MSRLTYETIFGHENVYEFQVHNRLIGHASKTSEGWVVHTAKHKRKPVETAELAAKQMLDAEIATKVNELNNLRAMLDKVLYPDRARFQTRRT